VDTIRADFGRGPLPPELARADAHQFVDAIVGGRRAAYPIGRLEPVAGGGMNAVLKSRELFANHELAVRRHLPAESAVEVGARERREALLRERLLTLRRHPVLPRYWTSGSVDGEPCEVFDFAPGVSLTSFVAKSGVSYGFVLEFAREAARGLGYLHRHGLIHGDVKPENFCVEERRRVDGPPVVRVMLIDFDIVSSPEEQIAQYALGNALEGTLPYMPPENFGTWVPDDDDEAVAMVFSKDVFALGMTLVRVINGRFPKTFYTSVNSLLEKKTRGDDVLLEFPDTIPPTLAVLVQAMCSGDWRGRPSLSDVIRTVRALLEDASREERESLVRGPRPDPSAPEMPSRAAAVASVGPYRVLDFAFGKRAPGDGQSLPIASLEDPFGRKLVGVPFAFASREEEEAFYAERETLLRELNAVRLKHSDLLPGSFRDLVREERDGRRVVWILRPLLEGAIDLTCFLETERPDAPLPERIAILRRVAQALAVLEEAGYVLPRLSAELVFFVPPDVGGSATRAAMTRPLRRVFDVATKDPSRFFRQELMGTANARRGPASTPDPTVEDLLELARGMRLVSELTREERTLLVQLRTLPSWRERAAMLTFLEMGGPHAG
jgi:serine/threonine protein kinase